MKISSKTGTGKHLFVLTQSCIKTGTKYFTLNRRLIKIERKYSHNTDTYVTFISFIVSHV